MIRKLLAAAALVAVCLTPALALAQDAGAAVPIIAPAASAGLFDWLSAHATGIGYALGAWVLVASLVNKSLWPKPVGPGWAVILHALLIDLPAFLPSVNFKGIFGLPITIPFLTLSGEARPSSSGTALVLVLVLGAGCPAGCPNIEPVVCGKGHIVPPDFVACVAAVEQVIADVPGDVAACKVGFTLACVEQVLATGRDILPCGPHCSDPQVRSARPNNNVLRQNVCDALKKNGHPEACQ